MRDAAIRALRTFIQAFIGTLAVLAIPKLTEIVTSITNSEPYRLDFQFWQGVGVAATISGIIALISWAQNALEEKTDTTIPAK